MTQVAEMPNTAEIDPASLGQLSPGELIAEIARVFRSLREDVVPRLPTPKMRGVVERELRHAEATACRAVLMDPPRKPKDA